MSSGNHTRIPPGDGVLAVVLCGLLAIASCAGPEDAHRAARIEQEHRLIAISRAADFIFSCEVRDVPRFFLYFPEVPGVSREQAMSADEVRDFLMARPARRSMASVYMEKTSKEWPPDLLDSIERLFQDAGFERVVIIQATGIPASPILRDAR